MVLTEQSVKHLQELKEHCGLTNDEIGRRAGLSTATVRRYIVGDVKDAPRASVEKVILAMGGVPEDFLPKQEAPESMIYKKLLEESRRERTETIDRMAADHAKALAAKDKWINRLFWVSVAIGVLFILVCIWAFRLDALIPYYGVIQY